MSKLPYLMHSMRFLGIYQLIALRLIFKGCQSSVYGAVWTSNLSAIEIKL